MLHFDRPEDIFLDTEMAMDRFYGISTAMSIEELLIGQPYSLPAA